MTFEFTALNNVGLIICSKREPYGTYIFIKRSHHFYVCMSIMYLQKHDLKMKNICVIRWKQTLPEVNNCFSADAFARSIMQCNGIQQNSSIYQILISISLKVV